MNDYTTLTEDEVMAELHKRDVEITTLNSEIVSIKAELQLKNSELETRGQELTVANDTISAMKTTDGIIESIINLEADDKAILTAMIRTDDKGIEAFQAINFGM